MDIGSFGEGGFPGKHTLLSSSELAYRPYIRVTPCDKAEWGRIPAGEHEANVQLPKGL